MYFLIPSPPAAPEPCGLLCLAEKHAGLGGWLGAMASVLAVIAALGIVKYQSRAERQTRELRRNQHITLILGVVDGLESVLEDFLIQAGHGKILNTIQYQTQNTPEMRAAVDLNILSVREWPTVEAYKQYKDYFLNTMGALNNADLGSTQPHHRQLFDRHLAARNQALLKLKCALIAARVANPNCNTAK